MADRFSPLRGISWFRPKRSGKLVIQVSAQGQNGRFVKTWTVGRVVPPNRRAAEERVARAILAGLRKKAGPPGPPGPTPVDTPGRRTQRTVHQLRQIVAGNALTECGIYTDVERVAARPESVTCRRCSQKRG